MAYNDKLIGEIKTVQDISIHIINPRDLLFFITDKNGERIEDAVVKAGNQTIPFDIAIHMYSSHKYKDWLIVTHKGEDFFIGSLQKNARTKRMK